MTDQVDAVDLLEHLPLLGAGTVDQILQRLPEETVGALAERLGGRSSTFAIGAFLVGAGIGGGITYLFANRRLEAKYTKISETEIEEMREHYVAKVRAVESTAAKRPVEEIIKARGYASSEAPPMAVQPPEKVMESEDESADEPDDSAMGSDEVEGPHGIRPPNVPITPASPSPEVRNVFTDHGPPEDDWDPAEERKHRSPDIPYVIHYDERNDMEGYDDMTLTFYEGDDVVCDDRDTPIDPDRRNMMFGTKNLERFGHGSGAAEIVYVRNDQLEIVFEIIKSPNHFAEEVHGFSHEGYDRGNLERMRARERDESEE